MDHATRDEITEGLEQPAAQRVWNAELWQHCYDLVAANLNDELLAYIHDDLIHDPGRLLFRPEPQPADLQSFSQVHRAGSHTPRRASNPETVLGEDNPEWFRAPPEPGRVPTL